jgi:hypothetical protein
MIRNTNRFARRLGTQVAARRICTLNANPDRTGESPMPIRTLNIRTPLTPVFVAGAHDFAKASASDRVCGAQGPLIELWLAAQA